MFTAADIIVDSDKKIREKSIEVKIPLSVNDKKLATALFEYVLNSTKGNVEQGENYKPAVGIAAIQVGIPKKILAIAYDSGDEEENIEVRFLLANAKIIQNSVRYGYLSSGEGCLSVEASHEGYVMRAHKVKVRAFDILTNKERIIEAQGYLAIVLQHEIDHFNGILYYDRINKNNPFQILENSVEIT